jgi:hypothetical protein
MSQPKRLAVILRGLGAALAGYVTVIAATTVGFTPLGGIIHLSAPLRIHVLASAVAITSGILGGMVAGWVGGRSPVRHALGTAAFLTVESTVLIVFKPSPDPVWFDVFGAVTLIAATVAGGYLWGRVSRRRNEPLTTAGSPAH